eukprot:Opistho-2@71583
MAVTQQPRRQGRTAQRQSHTPNESGRSADLKSGANGAYVVVGAVAVVLCAFVGFRLYGHAGHAVNEAGNGPMPTTTVVQRGLVVEKVTYASVLEEHARPSSIKTKHFPNDVLAYVTPWNGRGYDIAKGFGAKFTLVSPVWFLLRPSPSHLFEIVGGHDVDQGWLNDVRAASDPPPSIVPRFSFDGWSGDALSRAVGDAKAVAALSAGIVAECRRHGVDGLVLDIASVGLTKYPQPWRAFVKTLSRELKAGNPNAKLIVSAMPIRHPSINFDREDMASLANDVDFVSLMTYDYAGGSAGPTAPLSWVIRTVDGLVSLAESNSTLSRKILLGLNLYGYDYGNRGGEAILGTRFLELLTKHRCAFVWDDKAKEHAVSYRESGVGHKVFYPSLKSLSERIDLAVKRGLGLSLWEVGQGLDYFYDLL